MDFRIIDFEFACIVQRICNLSFIFSISLAVFALIERIKNYGSRQQKFKRIICCLSLKPVNCFEKLYM